jgi:hypothetical protein
MRKAICCSVKASSVGNAKQALVLTPAARQSPRPCPFGHHHSGTCHHEAGRPFSVGKKRPHYPAAAIILCPHGYTSSKSGLSMDAPHATPACAIEYSRKLGAPIRCKSLQAPRECREAGVRAIQFALGAGTLAAAALVVELFMRCQLGLDQLYAGGHRSFEVGGAGC